MEHCWKLSDENKNCAETCSATTNTPDPNSCFPYYNNGMYEENIVEWLKAGGAPDDVCKTDGVVTTNESSSTYPGAYISSNNCYFRESGNKDETIIDKSPHKDACTIRNPSGNLLCKCKGTSNVCSEKPNQIYPEAFNLSSFADEVIEDVFPYNVEPTWRIRVCGSGFGCPDPSYGPTPKLYIKKTNKISHNDHSVPNSASKW